MCKITLKSEFSSPSTYYFLFRSPHQPFQDWSGEGTHQQRTVAHEQINSNVAESDIRTARSCNYVIKQNRVTTSSSAATPRASHSPDIRKHGGRGHSHSNVTSPCLFFFFMKMKMLLWTCISSEQQSCQHQSCLAHYFWVLLSMNSWDQSRLSHKMSSDPNNSWNRAKSGLECFRTLSFHSYANTVFVLSGFKMANVWFYLQPTKTSKAICETITVRIWEYILPRENIQQKQNEIPLRAEIKTRMTRPDHRQPGVFSELGKTDSE